MSLKNGSSGSSPFEFFDDCPESSSIPIFSDSSSHLFPHPTSSHSSSSHPTSSYPGLSHPISSHFGPSHSSSSHPISSYPGLSHLISSYPGSVQPTEKRRLSLPKSSAAEPVKKKRTYRNSIKVKIQKNVKNLTFVVVAELKDYCTRELYINFQQVGEKLCQLTIDATPISEQESSDLIEVKNELTKRNSKSRTLTLDMMYDSRRSSLRSCEYDGEHLIIVVPYLEVRPEDYVDFDFIVNHDYEADGDDDEIDCECAAKDDDDEDTPTVILPTFTTSAPTEATSATSSTSCPSMTSNDQSCLVKKGVTIESVPCTE